MRTTFVIALVLVIIGGINWGLIGLFGFDLVAALFGGFDAPLARIVYVLVGIAALFCIPLLRPVSQLPEQPRRSTEGRPMRT